MKNNGKEKGLVEAFDFSSAAGDDVPEDNGSVVSGGARVPRTGGCCRD